jgi:hypothetical protein
MRRQTTTNQELLRNAIAAALVLAAVYALAFSVVMIGKLL